MKWCMPFALVTFFYMVAMLLCLSLPCYHPGILSLPLVPSATKVQQFFTCDFVTFISILHAHQMMDINYI